MRRFVLLMLLTMPGFLAAPAFAEGGSKLARVAPGTGCEAPALTQAAERRDVQDAEAAEPPPFRMALLTCARTAEGPEKRPLRRT